MTQMSPGKLIGLRRLADDRGVFKMLAVDQRPPIESLVAEARNADTADPADVTAVKAALLRALAPEASAVLLDPQYIYPQAIPLVPRDKGVLVTLEHDRFTETPDGRLSEPIPSWSVEKIKRSGADAVKVLAWYRPDASAEVRDHQQEFVSAVGSACATHDIPFVFELLLYAFPGEEGHTTGYTEHTAKRAHQVVESVRDFAAPEFGVDLFKLESPIPASGIAEAPAAAAEAFSALADTAGRPWVMLSAGMGKADFRQVLELAYEAGASGYLAGRAIWWDACIGQFPDLAALEDALETEARSYMRTINELTDEKAAPWVFHPGYGPEGPVAPEAGRRFRESYG